MMRPSRELYAWEAYLWGVVPSLLLRLRGKRGEKRGNRILRGNSFQDHSAFEWELDRAGKWAEASKFYGKALEIDPGIELFYTRLMNCYRQLGHKAEALAVYDRCREVLQKTLGLEPSAKTEKLRQEILQDEPRSERHLTIVRK